MSHWFQYPTKVSLEKSVTYLERAYLGQKKPVAQKYLFIAILCSKMFHVIIRPHLDLKLKPAVQCVSWIKTS